MPWWCWLLLAVWLAEVGLLLILVLGGKERQ